MQVELGSSETPKPHKKDGGRWLKENRDPILSIKANLLRGSFEEGVGVWARRTEEGEVSSSHMRHEVQEKRRCK